jgi:hypothetical protein
VRVAAVPDGWAIAWVEQSDSARPASAAVLAHLDRRGVPREPRRLVVDGANSAYGGPSLLAHGGALYLAIARPPPPTPTAPEQVFVTRLDCVAPAPPRCDAIDARSSGDDCTTLEGWAWDGVTCAPVICGCAGSECDRIAETQSECMSDHVGCR